MLFATALLNLCLLAPTAEPTAALRNQVGPCHAVPCPTTTIYICHNPSTGNSSGRVENASTGQVKYFGLGMGSTKKIYGWGVRFYPCGKLTWNDVNDCEDIWFDCAPF